MKHVNCCMQEKNCASKQREKDSGALSSELISKKVAATGENDRSQDKTKQTGLPRRKGGSISPVPDGLSTSTLLQEATSVRGSHRSRQLGTPLMRAASPLVLHLTAQTKTTSGSTESTGDVDELRKALSNPVRLSRRGLTSSLSEPSRPGMPSGIKVGKPRTLFVQSSPVQRCKATGVGCFPAPRRRRRRRGFISKVPSKRTPGAEKYSDRPAIPHRLSQVATFVFRGCIRQHWKVGFLPLLFFNIL